MGEFRALREYSHALRLVCEHPDLRAANANSNNTAIGRRIAASPRAHGSPITKAHCDCKYMGVGEFRALREYSHALRLVCEHPDLRAANANSNNTATGHRIAASPKAHGSPTTKSALRLQIYGRGRISSATNILRLVIGSRAAAALRRGCELQQYGCRPPHCGVS